MIILSKTFNGIFSLALDKSGSIASHYEEESDVGGWNLKLRRNLNDWELDDMSN